MSILHMETELVRQLAQQIKDFSSHTDEFTQKIKSLSTTFDWEGSSKSEFLDNIEANLRSLGSTSLHLSKLSDDVNKEVDQWENNDKSFVDHFQMLSLTNISLSFSAISWKQGWNSFIESFPFLLPRKALADAIPLLNSSTAGKDLLELANDQKITFIIIETGEKLGYMGEDGTVIYIYTKDKLLGDGEYNPSEYTITIDNDVLRKSEISLAAILAHEMQHAIDIKMYPFPNSDTIKDEDIQNFFDLSSDKQKEIEDLFSKVVKYQLETEVRAYARTDAVENGTNYFDDGILTKSEAQSILDHNINFKLDYEENYETTFAEAFPDLEFDVYVDSKGEVQVNIDKPSTREDTWWWPFD